MESFETELREGFLAEAGEILESFEQALLRWESSPGDESVWEELFRHAHNLKGGAKAVGFDGFGAFVHELETYLQNGKFRLRSVQHEELSLLLETRDFLSHFLVELRLNPAAQPSASALISKMRQVASTDSPAPEAVREPFAELADETYKSLGATRAVKINEAVRVSLERLDQLVNFVGEMVILQSVIHEQSLQSNLPALKSAIHQLGKVTKEVQGLSMGLRMIPMRTTFQKMRRIVRDTSASLGKKVELVTIGEDAEVDKTILELLADPLLHLVRNAVDHGIESAAGRGSAGKAAVGKLELKAYHQGDRIFIELRDDGAGIDVDAVRKKAVEAGLIQRDAVLSDADLFEFIFHPGFSTKTEITEISGRGMGMDIVKTHIARLRGEIKVTSERGAGTCFQLVLPLTLAIIDALIVKNGSERFAVPLSQIQESLRLDASALKRSSLTKDDYLWLREQAIPVFRLTGLLGRPGSAAADAEGSAVLLVRSQMGIFGVVVDEIVCQQQILIKKLGDEINGLKGVSGTTVLGDGKPALILELAELASGLSNQVRRAS